MEDTLIHILVAVIVAGLCVWVIELLPIPADIIKKIGQAFVAILLILYLARLVL